MNTSNKIFELETANKILRRKLEDANIYIDDCIEVISFYKAQDRYEITKAKERESKAEIFLKKEKIKCAK